MEEVSRDLAQVRRLVLERLRGHKARVFLFGSWVRGEARRYSDIDVAILPEDPLPPELLLDLQDELEASDVLYPVDLVDLTDAPAALRERVLTEGWLWSD
jgi:predicted nucleotidyltransferase